MIAHEIINSVSQIGLMKTSITSFNREIQVAKKPEPEPEEKINWWSIGVKVLATVAIVASGSKYGDSLRIGWSDRRYQPF